ncbi:hypothetical protein BH09ACT7_BH09ACT7_15690 [soil metagenome]
MDTIGDRARIAHALSELSAAQRAVLDRSFCGHLTTSQSAADLGITDGAVKSTLHDALWILKAEFMGTRTRFVPAEDASAARCHPRPDVDRKCG